MREIRKILMSGAECAVDLTDGSERGEYVSQDYIINKLGRPHRCVNLMFCYYPYDELWPGRASVVHASDDVGFAWDYPYDDYFTYKGGPNGTTEGEPFEYMRDIRRHGQDVSLTLTADPNISDEHIIAIANELRSFGRITLRLNHEATGNWFSFNRRCSYSEVADFYVRFAKLVAEKAPNVKMILCIGGIEKQGDTRISFEDEFSDAVRIADIWSVDKYPALHWGWPYDIAERGGHTHARSKISDVYSLSKQSFDAFCRINGGSKPMSLGEMNVDGDVTGAFDQVKMMKELYSLIKADPERWLSSVTFYQFRDRGRLGLEIEDPSNSECGIEQPILREYKAIIHDDFFMPQMKECGETTLPVTLRWGGAEDAEGIAVSLQFEANPVFCEAYFSGDENLMLELNGKWFYKAPKCRFVDFMPAFYEKPLDGASMLNLKIFAPPSSGENDLLVENGDINCYSELKELPQIRIRYEAIEL